MLFRSLAYAPATFIIKCFTAVIAYCIAKQLKKIFSDLPTVILAGVVGEAFMVVGYFVFEIFMLALSTSSKLTAASLTSGIVASASGIPFNIVQGIFGVIIATILYPILKRILKQTEGGIQ